MATFGKTDKGGTEQGNGQIWSFACKFTCPVACQAQSISIWTKNAGQDLKVAIYDSAKNLIGSGEVLAGTVADNFTTVSLSPAVILANADYYLLCRAEDLTGQNYYYDEGAVAQSCYKAEDYADVPSDPYAGDGDLDREYSFYCTYGDIPSEDQSMGGVI